VGLFCNQYVDGVPFLSETVELSMSGALVRRVLAPDPSRVCYALELGHPSEPSQRVFVCATPVWRHGAYEALRFIAQSHADRLRLANVIAAAA
jgi:hypothetical protein